MDALLSWLTLRSLIMLSVGIILGALIYDLVFDALDDRHSTRWFARRNFWLRLAAYGIAILVIVIATESLLKAIVALVGLGLVWMAFWLKNRNGHAPPNVANPTGNLKITLIDKPAFKAAAIKITYPDGTAKTVNHSMTLRGLEPGAYSVVADNIKVGSKEYEPDAAVNSVNVVVNRTAKLTITYMEA